MDVRCDMRVCVRVSGLWPALDGHLGDISSGKQKQLGRYARCFFAQDAFIFADHEFTSDADSVGC